MYLTVKGYYWLWIACCFRWLNTQDNPCLNILLHYQESPLVCTLSDYWLINLCFIYFKPYLITQWTKRPTTGPGPESLLFSRKTKLHSQCVWGESAFISAFVCTEVTGTQCREQCSFTPEANYTQLSHHNTGIKHERHIRLGYIGTVHVMNCTLKINIHYDMQNKYCVCIWQDCGSDIKQTHTIF